MKLVMNMTGAVVIMLLAFNSVCSAADGYECMIEPHAKIEFKSHVPGVIDEIMVERGDIIHKGQILARLKSGVEEALVEQSKALFGFAKRKDERNVDLSKNDLISVHEKDEMETELKKIEMQLKEMEERLKLRYIISTIDGVVMERNLHPGEYAGENITILKAAELNPLNVEVIVPLRMYGSIRKGMKTEVRPESPVSGVYKGEVVIVDKVVDAASGTFGVRIQLTNPDFKIPAGLKCRVKFVK